MPNDAKNVHSLDDHLGGYDPDHEHGDDADHDHDHDFSQSETNQEAVWLLDNVVLNSVGIDIGSSGTQLVFSRIHMRRIAEELSSRYIIVGREPIYQSPISLTPYLSETQMDTRGLKRIVAAAYKEANLGPDDIDTGAVILTGEALRRENSEGIADMLAEQGGEFVCATAGHHMEAMLAVYGSGAAKYSHEHKKRVLNVDIGGGTTKLGLVDSGNVIGTAAVHLGGRLIVTDQKGRITRLDPAGKDHARAAGFAWEIGSQTTREQLEQVADWMAQTLVRVLTERFTADDLNSLFLTDPIADLGKLDGLIFSGGVGEYVYERETRDFLDLGKLFGSAVRQRLLAAQVPWPLLPAIECIRATVLGASEYSIQLSGNTTFISNPRNLLPRKNMQVVPIEERMPEVIDPAAVVQSLRKSFQRYDLKEGDRDVAIVVRWAGPPEYSRLAALARGLIDGNPRTIAAGKPLYVIADGDIANSLGNLLRESLGGNDLFVIDGVSLRGLDYVDLGRIRMPSRTVPVTVKSLVFSEDPSLHGKSDASEWHAHEDGTVHRHHHPVTAGKHQHHDHAHAHGHHHHHNHDHSHGADHGHHHHVDHTRDHAGSHD
ncbi:ethanolamine ammonia-lyase reactivating factor EutA [Paraburkholderia edwinii]|uniref:Ethanolamine ammonia-lyase reactivating factor EutA n=1 Tax=Paraburkholderia edwinii TaxID=2861782 RepID=A0ABX8UW71_9BURK|nr:ethanolamine ammonia-lyase reactivating factor EutA [Paraburkholderia edwinii]QYD73229.1 ethanolamine ammonia-lyase reactivating factor EutA [Paraburkholderia edwinii]